MTLLQLNQGLYVHRHAGQLILAIPGAMYSLDEHQNEVIDLLRIVKSSGRKGNDVVFGEMFKDWDVSPTQIETMINDLQEKNIIKCDTSDGAHDLSDKSLIKFDRQIGSFSTLPGNNQSNARSIQKKIEQAHVAIVGIGGVGSYVALGLASMGIGKLTLFDFDEIELSNTSRQVLYQEQDVGMKKVDVAERNLRQTNPETALVTHNMKITSSDDLSPLLFGVDITILAADLPRGKIVYEVAEAWLQIEDVHPYDYTPSTASRSPLQNAKSVTYVSGMKCHLCLR